MKLYVTVCNNLRLGQVIRVFSTKGQATEFCKKFMTSPGYFRVGDDDETLEGYAWYKRYSDEEIDAIFVQEVSLNDSSIGERSETVDQS